MFLDILITVFIVVILFCLWIVLFDMNRFVVRNYAVKDSRIKKKVKAVIVADLHNKQYGKENKVLLNSIREQNPDFILMAGDIMTAVPGKSMQPAVHFLEELAKEYPIYYANGNHEHRIKLYPETYGEMATEYALALQKVQIEPMVNQHILLPEIGIAIYGVEIERRFYKRFRNVSMEPEYMTNILGTPDSEKYTVLLAHNPDYFSRYAEWGADLTVSGHVHGGIARVPVWGRGVISPHMRLFPKYDGGIFQEKSGTMLLSRGLGTHTIPVRFWNPGELWVVEFAPE